MSVSAELLCSFELLKPLDSSALKSHIKRGRNMRNNLLNSPVSPVLPMILPSNLKCSTPMLILYSLPHHLLKAFNESFLGLVYDYSAADHTCAGGDANGSENVVASSSGTGLPAGALSTYVHNRPRQ